MWSNFHKFLNILLKPESGIGRRIFLIVSQLTPIVNVELIIRDNLNQTLLIYREDEFYGPGWHLPGGILRFKENINTRIYITLDNELGIKKRQVQNLYLIDIFQIIHKKKLLRSHFISLIYMIRLLDKKFASPLFESKKIYNNGDIAFHKESPNNLIKEHLRYKNLINDVDHDNKININQIKTIDL